jgi:uncharacterized protein involved in exopolysaccharide biosynthesis
MSLPNQPEIPYCVSRNTPSIRTRHIQVAGNSAQMKKVGANLRPSWPGVAFCNRSTWLVFSCKAWTLLFGEESMIETPKVVPAQSRYTENGLLNRMTWKNWIYPIKAGFCVAILTAISSLFLANSYTSEARILPSNPKQGGSSLSGLAATAAALGIGKGSASDPSAAFVDILHSRWVRERLLLQTYAYQKKSWYFGTPKPHSRTLLAELGSRNLDRAMQEMREILTIQKDQKSNLITVKVITNSPELSQQVCQLALRLLDDYIQTQGQTHGGVKAAFATKQLADAQKESLEAERAFRDFLRQNLNYQNTSDPDIRLRGNRLEAELQLRRQIINNLAISREQALMEEKDDTPILNVLDAANLPMEKSRPKRGQIVIGAFITFSCLTWIWLNRAFLKWKLLNQFVLAGQA